ncbi:MAG TPA: polysaccharide lyase 6 family protein, partial [Chthoniobacteraceae bacterium]|nr:polysaccharide lyase 6 family protein [Chthoniobacteraceae bacterium]
MQFLRLALLVFGTFTGSALGLEYRAASAAEIERLSELLKPGDVVIMRNAVWTDQQIVLGGKGTSEAPITIRAETPGQVVLGGNSSMTIAGEHLVVSGLWLKDGTGTRDGIALTGSHCRLTQCAVTGGSYKFFVHLFGAENRVDHCYLADKMSDSPTLQVEVGKEPNHHRIDSNHFGPRPPLGRNGGETIRIGYSHQSMDNSGTVVERNLFDRCDGENEIISSKSCENTYRWNTFRDCAGMLTLRHGNRCSVDTNFFLGHGKRGSGGIRVIGEDHTVINNYIEGVTEGGIWITSGIPNSALKGYFQARNCLIAFNTVVDSRGPCVDLAAGFGSSGRTLR